MRSIHVLWAALPMREAQAAGRHSEAGTETPVDLGGDFGQNPPAQNTSLPIQLFSGFKHEVVYPEAPWPSHPRGGTGGGAWQ